VCQIAVELSNRDVPEEVGSKYQRVCLFLDDREDLVPLQFRRLDRCGDVGIGRSTRGRRDELQMPAS